MQRHWPVLYRQTKPEKTPSQVLYFVLYAITPKHLHTFHYCIGIPPNKYLTSTLHNIRQWLNIILCHIDDHLSGFHMMWRQWKWRCDLVNGLKHNLLHVCIPLDWTKQSVRLCMKLANKIQYLLMITSNAQFHNNGNYVSLDIFIKAPMHLIFLGMVKSMMKDSDKYWNNLDWGTNSSVVPIHI